MKYFIASKNLDKSSIEYMKNAASSMIDDLSEVYMYNLSSIDNPNLLIKEINEKKPSVIISLGSEPSKILNDKVKFVTNSRGKLLQYNKEGYSTKMIVTYSPKFLLSDNPSMDTYGPIFMKDLEYAVKYVKGELIDVESKNLQYAKTYDDLKSYYDNYLVDAIMPAYDIETNAKDPRSDSFKIIGYSLAPNGSTGIYVIKESLEYKMPEEDWQKCVELTKDYISSRTVLVHNIMYERPATLNEWDINITNFEDSLIKARLLLGGRTGAGLKEQCTRNLGYPDWDTDLHVYLDNLDNMMNRLKPTPMGRVRDDYNIIKEEGVYKLLDLYNSKIKEYDDLKYKYEYTPEDSIPKEDKYILDGYPLDNRQLSLKESIESMIDLLSNYYEDIHNILELVGKEALNLVDIQHEGIIPYSSVPMNIITKYGALDSVGTQDLNEFLDNRIKNESTKEVDLSNGYRILKSNFIVASDMEMNGLYWNDEIASDTRKWLADKAYNAMLSMLRSGLLDKNIFENSRQYLLEYVKNEELDKVREILGDFDLQKSGIKLRSSGKRVTWKNLLDELGEEFINSHYTRIIDYIKSNLGDKSIYPDYESFKPLFNPSSNLILDTLKSIFMSKELMIANAVKNIIALIKSGIDIDSQPNPDRILYRTYLSMTDYNNKIDEGTIEGKKISQKDIFYKMMESINVIRANSPALQDIIKKAASFSLQDTSEPTIVDIYESMSVMGYDIEDESTWDDKFRFLIDFRTYKKCIKLISSYIDGSKVGRGSVWVINKRDIVSNKKLPLRKRLFSDKSSDEEYLMQAYWAPCSAATLRWRAGVHTIPSGPMIKGIYTSRYKGGVIAAPDYSQQEIRTVAGLSNCTNLLEAYRNGEDVHMRTAMSVFKRPADQITKNERRFCLAGDTKIRLYNDFVVSIKLLAKLDTRDLYVYSYDIQSEKVVKGKIVCASKTTTTNTVIRLSINYENEFGISSSRDIECTDNHRFLLKNNTYVEAKDLRLGDVLKSYNNNNDSSYMVVRKEIHYLSYNVDMYDLEIDKYDNFLVDLGDNSGVFVHNCKMCTFGILYGASPQGLADLTGSSIEEAQNMVEGFYKAYPELKVWMDKKHREVEEGGRVSCPKVGYFLDIDTNGHGGLEEAYRQAGNAPVQGQSSLIAGYVLNSINQYLIDNNMKTKPISFIHDSLEFDIHPLELFKSCKKITALMNDIPNDEFGIPSKAELTIGTSMGDENEVTYIEENDVGGVIELKGYMNDLDEILNNWRSVYSSVEFTDDKDSIEDVYVPRKEMFLPKLTISKYNGTTRRLVKRRFDIVF